MDSIRLLIATLIASGVAVARADTTVVVPASKPQAISTTKDACVDQELADKLSYKRHRRGRIPRDFVKAQRHELSVMGGYYVSDLFAGTYAVGGAYTYHMTEETAVEASFTYTRADATIVRSVEGGRATEIVNENSALEFGTAALVWYPLHGKLRMGGEIVHFDLHTDAGVGVVTSETSRGVMGLGGIGIKLYSGKAVAWRIDVRDHVYRQELLDEHFIVNDLSVTAGFSLFLPLGF
jgi:outer membrane beta-barrel protein